MTSASSLVGPCADVAATLGDHPRATAPVAGLWLAIEDGGPWGPRGLVESSIDPGVADAIQDRADAAGVRVQLIRRREITSDGTRTVLLARSVPGGTWLRRWTVTDPSELLEVPWSTLDRAAADGPGETVSGPIVLVCAHARRDACCARYGRPVVAAAMAMAPGATWETTHTGGHRFAGNVVVLPHGIVYGRVEPDDVAHLLDTHRRGLLDLPRFRGRSAHPRPVQAADWFLRDRLGLTGIDDIELTPDPPRDAAGVTTVAARADGRRFEVRVELVPTGAPRSLSCDADGEDPGTWRLVGLDETG